MAAEHLTGALALGGRPIPSSTATMILNLTKQLLIQFRMRLTSMHSRATPDADCAAQQLASHIYERLAEIAYFENRPLPLLHATLASLNLAEAAGATRETVDGFAAPIITKLEVAYQTIRRFATNPQAVPVGVGTDIAGMALEIPVSSGKIDIEKGRGSVAGINIDLDDSLGEARKLQETGRQEIQPSPAAAACQKFPGVDRTLQDF